MSMLRSWVALLAVVMSLGSVPAWAQSAGTVSTTSGNPNYEVESPPAFRMVGDLLIARPLLIGATVIGAGIFVISLPFTAAGGNIGQAGKALVVDPGKAAFVRCLGCTRSGYGKTE